MTILSQGQGTLFQACNYPEVVRPHPYPLDVDADLWATFHELDPRAAQKVEPDPNTGCWVWLAACDYETGGYGRVTRNNTCLIAHRYVYELLVGPIPAGLFLDHLCRRPPCVRPTHLEPVTPQVNTQRGVRKQSQAECGTRAGYQRHRACGESACPRCRAANNADARMRRLTHKRRRR